MRHLSSVCLVGELTLVVLVTTCLLVLLEPQYPIWSNNVLLGKIEGPVWYTIYHQLPVVIRGKQTPLLTNQGEKDINVPHFLWAFPTKKHSMGGPPSS